jgi:hypothetical protein
MKKIPKEVLGVQDGNSIIAYHFFESHEAHAIFFKKM